MLSWLKDFFVLWFFATGFFYMVWVTLILLFGFVFWDWGVVDFWVENWWVERASIALGFLVSVSRSDLHGN